MLPLHLSPGMLVVFMVMLAVVPLAIIWLDEHRGAVSADRLARLRDEVRLRDQLMRRSMADADRQSTLVLPQA